MSALRLARGFTGRSKVVKFAGLLPRSRRRPAGLGRQRPGDVRPAGLRRASPASSAGETIVLPFNDVAALEAAFAEHGDRSPPSSPRRRRATWAWCRRQPGFTEALRRVTAAHGALLISDEVMTGFRCSAAGWYGLEGPYDEGAGRPVHLRQGHGWRVPGRGVRRPRRRHGPCSRRSGRSTRPARCPGTRSPPPRAWRRCAACTPEVYDRLGVVADDHRRGASTEELGRAGVPHVVQRAGSMFSVFFRDGAVRDYDDARAQDARAFRRSSTPCCSQGVHLPPSAFEAWFVAAAHDDAAVDRVLARAARGGARRRRRRLRQRA